jgi:hypothetical protein
VIALPVTAGGRGRRTHIYRNLGDLPNPTLQEQLLDDEVVGIPTSSLQGTHDIAVFDVDGDDHLDLVLGRCTGTSIWISNPCPTDTNGDDATDVDDLVRVILDWGTDGGGPADINGDGIIGVLDLVAVILAWGPCP